MGQPAGDEAELSDAIKARQYVSLLLGLEELGDDRVQRALWLNQLPAHAPRLVGSLDEAMCAVFNDSGLEYGGINGATPDFPPKIDGRFVELSQALNSLPRANFEIRELIDLPEMQRVRDLATSLWDDVQTFLSETWIRWTDAKWRRQVGAAYEPLVATLAISSPG
jgi:hypothetical protein